MFISSGSSIEAFLAPITIMRRSDGNAPSFRPFPVTVLMLLGGCPLIGANFPVFGEIHLYKIFVICLNTVCML